MKNSTNPQIQRNNASFEIINGVPVFKHDQKEEKTYSREFERGNCKVIQQVRGSNIISERIINHEE